MIMTNHATLARLLTEPPHNTYHLLSISFVFFNFIYWSSLEKPLCFILLSPFLLLFLFHFFNSVIYGPMGGLGLWFCLCLDNERTTRGAYQCLASWRWTGAVYQRPSSKPRASRLVIDRDIEFCLTNSNMEVPEQPIPFPYHVSIPSSHMHHHFSRSHPPLPYNAVCVVVPVVLLPLVVTTRTGGGARGMNAPALLSTGAGAEESCSDRAMCSL
jgi:hypothetical protein